MIRVHVSPTPIDLAAEMAGVERADGAGAVATFTGLVRSDDGVGTLELEHYPGATEAALTRLAEEATARWALGAATIVHRVGPMAPGERIVFVAAAAAHRGGCAGGVRLSDRPAEDRCAVLEARDPRWRGALGGGSRE